ncbi:MAG: hypothetical protein U1C74_03380 [Phenylobacterium sp.]|nr:hypothetical protein [Phenylobacterium sp.]
MRAILSFAAISAVAGLAAPAAAQTAAQINRMNQAVQICNSPGGAAIPECAQLNARLGLPSPGGYGASAPGMGLGGVGLGGGGIGGGTTAGILGALNAAMATRSTAPVAAPAAPAVNSQGVADCVRNAAGNTAAIQACLTVASAPRPAAPTLGGLPGPRGAPALGQPFMPAAPQIGASQGGSAMGIYHAGQNYQACVAANPNDWRSCLHLVNGGVPTR